MVVDCKKQAKKSVLSAKQLQYKFSYAIIKNERDADYIFFTPDQTLNEIKVVYPYETTLKLIKPINSDYVEHDRYFV